MSQLTARIDRFDSHLVPAVYTVSSYGSMIVDKVRMSAYNAAIQRVVTPASVVLDLGSGTGICALLACRHGARRVYAIETNPAITVGQESATACGYSDRIVWIHDTSTRVILPEKVDVLVSDLRGVLPLYADHLNTIFDARERFLKPGGALIPSRDRLLLCPVQAPEAFRDCVEPWVDNEFALDLKAGQRFVTNSLRRASVSVDQFLAQPIEWASIDYTVQQQTSASGEVVCTIAREGVGHGLSVWFDTDLIEGVGFSTAPNQQMMVYGSAFFPWSSPVALHAGDVVKIRISATLVAEDYVWQWSTDVLDGEAPKRLKARFRQSTFQGIPFSPAQLKKRAGTFRPTLGLEGRVVKYVLDRMADHVALQDVATELTHEFPVRFARVEDALAYVGELSVKYSESPDRQPAQAG